MKKYLFGLVALIFALATSAFTSINHDRSSTTVEDPLYWFDPTGTSYEGFRVKGDIFTTDTQIYETECDGDDTQDECQRGFTNDKLLISGQPENGVDPSKLGQYSEMIYVAEN
jgi:hypothetical protein